MDYPEMVEFTGADRVDFGVAQVFVLKWRASEANTAWLRNLLHRLSMLNEKKYQHQFFQ